MLYLFNTNIIPSEAVVRVKKISAEYAAHIAAGTELTSAIGHEATAVAMGMILERSVTVNRIQAEPKPFDKAISLKLNGRLQEGVILDQAAMEEMGYTLYLLEFYPTDYVIAPPSEYHTNSQYF